MADLSQKEQQRLDYLRNKFQNTQRSTSNAPLTKSEIEVVGDEKTFTEKIRNFVDNSGELAAGVGQSLVGSLTAPGRAIQKRLPQTPGGQAATEGIEQSITAQNKLQQTGQTIGDIGQLVAPIPGAKAQVAKKATGFFGNLLSKIGTNGRGLASEVTRDVATSALQENITPGSAATDVGAGVFGNVILPKALTKAADLVQMMRRTPTAQTSDGILDLTLRELEQSTPESSVRSTAEQQAKQVPLSLSDRLIGLTPDLKQTLSKAGPDKTQRYVDVVMARNQGATLSDGTPIPSATSYGAERVAQVQQKVENILNDTGSDLGQFRQKIATIEVPRDSVIAIKGTLDSELSKLNLTIQNGQVVPVKGKIVKAKAGDIKAIQELQDNYKIFSQSPNVENLIDLRSVFENKINFGKRAAEVSNDVDPLSRALRNQIAEINRTTVGADQAATITKYSDTISALQELRSYTERRAGSEFLLKRVLSERDREVRKILKDIEDITGDDLLEDATLVKVTTDLLGNAQQKGLFRQEITSANADLLKVLGGDKAGVISSIIDKGSRALINEEELILRASRGQ